MSTNKPLKPEQAAAYLGISLSYLYKLTHRNEIKHSNPTGGRIFFKREWLDDYAYRNTKPTTAEREEQLADEADDFLTDRGL